VAAVLTDLQSTPDNTIALLYRSEFGKVEFLRCNGVHPISRRRELARRLHFTLPIVGSFVWHADQDDVFADPTTLLCTHAGESFRMSHPHGGDHSLVFTPSEQVRSQLSERAEAAGLETKRRTLVAPARAQMIAYTLYVDSLLTGDAFAADECLLQFFESVALDKTTTDAQAGTAHFGALIRRTLDYVHHTPEPLLTLHNIAAALQVRPAYLTSVFARRTGRPLYRYVMSLKLSRALHRLATTDEDLTQLALELGFSSHSHLSAAFKARYGMSPSEMRYTVGRRKITRASRQPVAAHRAVPVTWRQLCAARGGEA
jgi:AraC-like DNA-binding protein